MNKLTPIIVNLDPQQDNYYTEDSRQHGPDEIIFERE
jgi:hypothetical protein